MHSTTVHLLRSVAPLGLLVLLQTAVSGQTFMAVGTVSYTHPVNPNNAKELHHPFTAYVDADKWLIRTINTDADDPRAFYEAAFNGTDRFLHTDMKVPGRVGEAITSLLRIEPSPTPEADTSLTSPVWIALASANHFRKLPNSTITPLWLNPPRSRVTNYNATGSWKFADKPPLMIREAALYETAGWLDGPYKDGFLRQRYFVTAWTNLDGLMLPLEGVLQDHLPKRLMKNGKPDLTGGKFTWIGKDRDDTEPSFLTIWTVTVQAYQLGAKPTRFEPSPPARTYVQDRRFEPLPHRAILSYILSDQQTATNGAVRLKSIPAPDRK